MKKHHLQVALTIVLAITLVIATLVLVDVNEERKFLRFNVDTRCYSEFSSFCQGCRVKWDEMDEEARTQQKEENQRHLYTALQLYGFSSYLEDENFGSLLHYLWKLSIKGELYEIMDDDMADQLNALYPHLGKEEGSALAKDAYDRLVGLAALKGQE